jgi:hypothetical protein
MHLFEASILGLEIRDSTLQRLGMEDASELQCSLGSGCWCRFIGPKTDTHTVARRSDIIKGESGGRSEGEMRHACGRRALSQLTVRSVRSEDSAKGPEPKHCHRSYLAAEGAGCTYHNVAVEKELLAHV